MRAVVDYQNYIHSEEWNNKRRQVIHLFNWSCQKCWSGSNLNVHHWTYKRLWDEMQQDLFLMCSICHKEFHDKYWVKWHMMKETRKFLCLSKIQIPKVKKKKTIKEPKVKNQRKLKNKIFELDPSRALLIMSVLESLSENWMCSLKFAAKQWITFDEWIKTQHFFLANSSTYKDKIIEELRVLI